MRLIKKCSSVSGTPTDSTPTSHNFSLVSLPSSPPPAAPQHQQPSASTSSASAPSTSRPPSLPSSPEQLPSEEKKERDKSGENRYPPSSFFPGHGWGFGRMRSFKGKKRATKREDGTMSEGEGGDLDVGRERLGLAGPQVQDPPGPSRPVVASPPPTAPPAPASAPAPPPRVTPPRPLPTRPKPTQTVPVPPVANPSPRRPLPHPPLSPSTGARFEGRSRKSGATGKARSQGDLRITTTPGVPSGLAVHTPASNTAPVAVGFPAPPLGLGDTLVPLRLPFASTPSASSALSTASGESSFSLIPTPRADDGQPHSRSIRNEPGAPKKLTKRRPVSMVGEGYGYDLVESPVDLADSASGAGLGERVEMARAMAMERAERHARGHNHGHSHARSASTGSSATRLADGTFFVLVNSSRGAPSAPPSQPQPPLQISTSSHLLPPSQGASAPLPLPHPPHHHNNRHSAQDQPADMLWSLNRNPSTSTTTGSTSSAAGPSTDESALVSTPAEYPAPAGLAAGSPPPLENLWAGAGRMEEGRKVVSRASTASFREGDDGSVVGVIQGIGALGLKDPAVGAVGDGAGREQERERGREQEQEQERSKEGSTKSGPKHSPTESTVHGSPSTGRTHRKREGSPTLSAERSVKTITPMASLGDGQAWGMTKVGELGATGAGGVEGNERVSSDVEDIIEAYASSPGSAGPSSHANPRPRAPTSSSARPPLNRLRSTSLASTSLGTNSVYSVGEVGTATVGVMMTALAVNLDVGGGIGAGVAGEDEREAEGATSSAEGVFDPLVQTSADLRAAFDIERDPAWQAARQSAEDSAAAATAQRARQRQRQYVPRAPPIPPHLSPTQGYRQLPNLSTGGQGQRRASPTMFEYTPSPLSAGAAPPRAHRAPASAPAPSPHTRTARAQSQPPRRRTTSPTPPTPAEQPSILAPMPVSPTKRPAMMDKDGSLGKIFRKISFGRGSGKKKKVGREGVSPDGRGEETPSPMAGEFGAGSGSGLGAGGRPGLPRSGSVGSPLKQRRGLFTASPESFTPPSRGGSVPSPSPAPLAPEASGSRTGKDLEVPAPGRLVKKRSQQDIHRVPKPQPHRAPDSTQHIPSVTPMGLMITNPDPKSAPGTPGETLESVVAGQGMVVSTMVATSSSTTTGAGGTVSSTSTTLVASTGAGSLSATTAATSSGFRTILGPYTPPELNPLPSYFSTPPRPYSPSAPSSPRLRPRTMLHDAASHEARRQVRHTLVLIKDDAEFKNMLEEFARMEDDPRLIAAGGGGFAMRHEGEGEGEGKVVVKTKSMELLEADAKRKRMQAWFSTREIVLGEQKVAEQLKRALMVAQVAATKHKEFMPMTSPTTPPAPHSAPPGGASGLDPPPSLGSRGHKRTGSNGFLRSRRPSLSEKRSSDPPLPTPTSSSSSVPPVPALPTPRPTPSPQPSQDTPSPAPAAPTASSSPVLTLLTHLPSLINIFETLSSAFSHDPSPYGVAEAFVEMEDELTRELALWASEVGPVMVSSAMEGLNRILDEDRRKRGKKGAGDGDDGMDGSMGRLAFSDIILSPIQRAARYTMHFTQLSAHLDPGSRTYQKVVLAIEASQRLAQECDNAQEMDQELLRMPGGKKKKQRPASVGYGVGGGSGGLWS
ncbi:hypothetical protein IAT38_001461 [Cryptococcus sp. DSM 104549]